MKTVMEKIKQSFLFWLLLGISLRLILMPISNHSDMWAHSMGSYLASHYHTLNISDYMRKTPDPEIAPLYVSSFFPYPLTPLLFFMGRDAFFQPFYRADYFQFLLGWFGPFLTHSTRFLYLFLWKLPYLFFDLGVAFLLTKFFTEQKDKLRVFALWMVNPFALYVTFIFGHYDIIPAFFVLLSLVLALKDKSLLSLLALGIGIAFKTYPLLVLPIIAVVLAKNNLFRFLFYSLLGLLPFALTALPFISSSTWRQDVLFSYQSQFLLAPSLPAGRGESIVLFPLLWMLVFGAVFLGRAKKETLWAACLAVLLIVFSISFYHPQWIIWLAPFLVLLYVKNRQLLPVISLLFLLWLVLTSLFERSLTVGLFAPLWPKLHEVSSLGELLDPVYPTMNLKNIIRGLFAAPGLYLFFQTLRSLFLSSKKSDSSLCL